MGTFAIATRRLSSWHRFAPFFIVWAMVAAGLVSGTSQGTILGITLFLGIAYIFLVYAVRAEKMPLMINQPVEVVQG